MLEPTPCMSLRHTLNHKKVGTNRAKTCEELLLVTWCLSGVSASGGRLFWHSEWQRKQNDADDGFFVAWPCSEHDLACRYSNRFRPQKDPFFIRESP